MRVGLGALGLGLLLAACHNAAPPPAAPHMTVIREAPPPPAAKHLTSRERHRVTKRLRSLKRETGKLKQQANRLMKIEDGTR